MSLPREPRQKMINMMYLVLTALLALNVSSEILNAFKTVNKSLEKTNEIITSSTGEVMSSLNDLKADPATKERATIWYQKAEDVQKASAAVYSYIQSLKDQILTEAGGNPKDSTKKYKEDNLDIATRIMIEKGNGPKLKDMLEKYRSDVLGMDRAIDSAFHTSLPINTQKPSSQNRAGRTWEGAYFHMVPTVAAMTILSKFQNDVKTSENKVVTFCHEQVGKVKIRYNTYEPIVGQNSSVLLPGQELQITAGLAAFNSDQKPTINIGGQNITPDAQGKGLWKQNVSSSGQIPVRISFRDQDGNPQTRDFKVEYTVGQSNAAVQLDKMNVLFIGVDNPVTVSGSGSAEKLQVSISGGGGSIRSNGVGHYLATVNTETNECFINVTTVDGKTTRVPFRVRSIPDPKAMVGRNKGGNMPAAQFKAQGGVSAVLEDFYYETQFLVTSFHITGDGEGFPDPLDAQNTGNTWNPQAQNIVNRVRNGSYIYIEDIKCVGPDKRTRNLPPIYFNLK
jgi:gliding motility-associated protein GldM